MEVLPLLPVWPLQRLVPSLQGWRHGHLHLVQRQADRRGGLPNLPGGRAHRVPKDRQVSLLQGSREDDKRL